MGVLLMLMTIGGVVLAIILLVAARWTRKTWLTKFVLGAVAVWFLFYAAMLFGFSLMSKEENLGLNEPKAFCGFYFDCHVHTAVGNVRKTKQIGDKTAKGEFYIVTVKVSSDARSVALGLLAPQARVVDESGKFSERDKEAESVLIGTTTEPPFDLKVPAGGAFEKQIVFDLPPNVENPRLDIAEGIGIDKVIEAILVDDEDSIFHKRNYFKLEEQRQTADVK